MKIRQLSLFIAALSILNVTAQTERVASVQIDVSNTQACAGETIELSATVQDLEQPRFKGLLNLIQHSQDSTLISLSGADSYSISTTDMVAFNHPDAPKEWSYQPLEVSKTTGIEETMAITFTPLVAEYADGQLASVEPVQVAAGEYHLYLGFRSKNHPNVNVYFNDEMIAEKLEVNRAAPWNYDRTNNIVEPGIKWDGDGGLVGQITVTNETPAFKIKVEMVPDTTGIFDEAIKLYHWALRPVDEYVWSNGMRGDHIEVTLSESQTLSVSVSNFMDAATGEVFLEVNTCNASGSILGNDETLEINIYPNPTTSYLNIRHAEEQLKVVILDLQGKMIHQSFVAAGNHSIDLQEIPAGLYQLLLIDGKSTIHNQGIIKQ